MAGRIKSGYVICGVCHKRVAGYTKYSQRSGALIPSTSGHLRAWEHGQHRTANSPYDVRFCLGSGKDFPQEDEQ